MKQMQALWTHRCAPALVDVPAQADLVLLPVLILLDLWKDPIRIQEVGFGADRIPDGGVC